MPVRYLLPLILLVATPLVSATGESCSRAAWFLAHGDPKRALGALTGVDDPTEMNVRGLAEMMKGDLDAALRTFTAALEKEPKPTLRLNRGIVLLRLARNEEAAAAFDSVFASDDTPPSIRGSAAYHRAMAAERLGRLEEASLWLDRALELDPASADALIYSGVILERRGAFEAAGKRYRSYLDQHPGSILAMLRFGIVAQRAGHRELALKYLREVALRSPHSLEAVEARKYLVMWE